MMPFKCFLKTSVLASMLTLPLTPAFAAAERPKIAEGRPWSAADLGISLTPPIGWQIQPNLLGKTLVLQPVRSKGKIKDYSKPIYNRNITVAVLHEARPIDETEVAILRKKLELDFGQAPGVSGFQVIESRFIDYRQKADGILLYTAFQLNGYPMSQMHVFISGSKNSALLTYTDLADAFQSNEDAMTLAWNAMLSTELTGTAPRRYQDLMGLGSAIGLVLVAGCLVLLLRRRSAHRMYEGEEEKLYRDDSVRDEEFSDVTGLATQVASASGHELSQGVTDVWNLATTQVSTPLPKARKKRVKSMVETAW